jgi:amphiphysin
VEFINAEKMYKDMNDELLDEMPTLYDSRIAFMLNGLRALFNSENKFHGETAKVSVW